MDAAFTILSVVIWALIIGVWAKVFSAGKRRRATISSDGHVVPPNEDVTCEGKDGHNHPKMTPAQQREFGPRYIVHNEPETGYVVLNGVKRRISDCKDL